MHLTTYEASQKHKISQRHVWHLVSEEIVKGRQAGKVWLVDDTSLRKYLASKPKPGPKPRKKSS